MDMNVSLQSISNVINNIGTKRKLMSEGEEVSHFKRYRSVRTEENIKAVKKYICKKNPKTHSFIQNKLNMSTSTINKIIHKDLDLETEKKTKVQVLNSPQKRNRKTNSRKLYEEELAGDKCEYVITLDEALIYLQDCNNDKKIRYVKKGQKVSENWTKFESDNFKKVFMIVGAISGRGVLPLIKVPNNVKICGQYCVDHVLRPIIEKFIPYLYPNEMHKVFLHHDKASSHTCNITQRYLEEASAKFGIRYIKNSRIMVKSPDGSPLDFYGFGNLKQKLYSTKVTTLNGLWKKAKEIWNSISKTEVDRVYGSWKRRCRLIHKKSGNHIEHTKNLHKRTIIS
jgi:hypothetical protein